MGKYVAKRIGYMALVFLIVSFLMYSLYNLIPTDPARAELEAQKQSLKPAEYEQLYQELRAKMGLDDPLVIRYMRWMGLWPDVGDNNGFNGLLQGNFGYSQFYKKDVTEVIVDPMKNTIFINIFSTILALAITIPLGIFCAVHKGKKVDNTVQVVTMLGYSLPIYIIALILCSSSACSGASSRFPARRPRARFTRPSGTSSSTCSTTSPCRSSL